MFSSSNTFMVRAGTGVLPDCVRCGEYTCGRRPWVSARPKAVRFRHFRKGWHNVLCVVTRVWALASGAFVLQGYIPCRAEQSTGPGPSDIIPAAARVRVLRSGSVSGLTVGLHVSQGGRREKSWRPGVSSERTSCQFPYKVPAAAPPTQRTQ